jgi:hypothetical protein
MICPVVSQTLELLRNGTAQLTAQGVRVGEHRLNLGQLGQLPL